MKQRSTILFLFIAILALCAFASENPYFIISREDVALHLPKGFGKPAYTFRNNTPTPEGFVLGRRLFYDPVLSADSSTSCASCHQRFAAFGHMDHPLSHGINGLIGKRNVSALQNLIWKDSYMWDGGVTHLELQPIAPITNAKEMGESLPNIIHKLQHHDVYPQLFKQAFGDTAITTQRLFRALTQFTGLMISSNARYDKYIAGKELVSAEEKRGLSLFRANCAACHREPLFTNDAYRNNGIACDTSLNDIGRGAITGNPWDNYCFKVPSLRNVEMTYPYMHDGRFRNLAQVLQHYSGSSVLQGRQLLAQQQQDIIAFLKTLTDKTFLYDRRFADPFSY